MSPAQQAQIDVRAARIAIDLLDPSCTAARKRAAHRWLASDSTHAKALQRILRELSRVRKALQGPLG